MLNKKADLPRVLVGCPINIVKDYCMDQWLDMVKNLTYRNYDIYLVDNTKNPLYHKKLRENHNLKIDWVDPAKKEARYYMADCIEKIRTRAVKKNYDYLFILEVDIFPSPDIIENLIVHDLPVVGATYFTGQGDKTFLQLLYLEQIEKGKYLTKFYKNSHVRRYFKGGLIKAHANGNGAILIKKEILRRLHFRVDESDIGHADSFFHQDLFKMGIINWVDTSILPVHWNSRWSSMPDDAQHAKMQESKTK